MLGNGAFSDSLVADQPIQVINSLSIGMMKQMKTLLVPLYTFVAVQYAYERSRIELLKAVYRRLTLESGAKMRVLESYSTTHKA